MHHKTFGKFWDQGGLIAGPVDLKDREDSHIVLADAHTVEGGVILHGGAMRTRSFQRYHRPLELTVEIGKTAPRLFQCLCGSVYLPKVELDFWRLAENGEEERYFQIALSGATVIRADSEMPATRDTDDFR